MVGRKGRGNGTMRSLVTSSPVTDMALFVDMMQLSDIFNSYWYGIVPLFLDMMQISDIFNSYFYGNVPLFLDMV
jgi:hypothetical protein